MSLAPRLFAAAAAAALCFASTGTACAAVPAEPAAPRALWVWGTTELRRDPAQAKAFFNFLAAPGGHPERAVGTLFFDGMSPADFADPKTAAGLRAFLAEARKRRLRVDFLCGDAGWAEAAHHDAALANLKAVLAFNRAGRPAERFDGFQYDVEPYLLKAWPSPDLRRDYLALLDKAAALIRAGGGKLLLGAAIPRFFHNESTGHLDREVLDRIDYIALMDYVDSPERFVNDAALEVAYAAKTGKKVWLGVETQELKDEPMATFYAKGNDFMETALAAGVRAYGKSPGFAGLAIHHWNSYRVFARPKAAERAP